MTKKQERNIIASVGTVLFMGFVILLLWLLQLSVTEQPKKDYIEVEYLEEEVEEPKEEPKPKYTSAPAGRGEQGGGKPAPSAAQDEQTVKSAEPIVSEEEQLAIRAQHEADSIREDQQKKTKKATDLISSINFSDTGEDPAPAKDPKPAPPGPSHGPHKDGAGEWNLDGRDLVGRLPQPSGEFNEDAKVVVKIRVNANGDVIEAKWSDQGTQNANSAIIKMAENAAKRAKFTKGKHDQIGTITYIFKVK